MQLSIVQFFDNLPQKQCRTCGSVLDEQADCYWNHCFDCLELHVSPMSLAPRYAAARTKSPA